MTWTRAIRSAMKDLEQPVLWILGLCGAILVAWDLLRGNV